MEEGAFVRNSRKDEYGDPQVLNSMGLGHLLVLFWTESEREVDDKGRLYYELTIHPNKYHIIGCDDNETRNLLLYRSHFLSSTIRSYLDGTKCKGAIDRVYKKCSPEMSPNISFYFQHEYPHLDFALSCGILSSFCFPFRGSGKYGVMEIVSTCNQDVQGLGTFCRSITGLHWLWRFRNIEYAQPVREIDHLLEVVSQTFQLPLTQYWNFQGSQLFLVQQFSYRIPKINWYQFKDALHLHLDENAGPLGRSIEETGAFFCRDITALSITQYPLAHYARNCGSIPCFAIKLCNNLSPYDKWMLQFFLPAQEYPQTLLNSIWEKIKDRLPDYKLASGEQLGQVLSVKVINSSAHIEPESFKIGQHNSSLPHLEVSEHTRTSNLFENNSGKRSNSFSYEEAAVGEMSKRIPNEVFQLRTSDEHFEIRGKAKAVAVERDYELDSEEQLGQGFSVHDINAFKVAQPYSSLPQGSEHNFMNLLEIATEQSSFFYQKAATGKTPKRTPNEASWSRRCPGISEEYFETTGNTVADDRGQRSNSYYDKEADIREMSERVPSEAFQPRTYEEHLEIRGNIRGNTMVSEIVDEPVEKLIIEDTPHATSDVDVGCADIDIRNAMITASPPFRFQTMKKTIQQEEERMILEIEGDTSVQLPRISQPLFECGTEQDKLEYDKTSAVKRLKISETSFTLENIRKHFGRPQKDAAESFGVSLSTFKRNCRLIGITRWQPGKRKLIDNETDQRKFSAGMPHMPETPAVAHTGQEMNNMDVKVMYNGVPVRFEIPTSSGITELENNVIERLPLTRKSFSIKYQDDEGDWVLIACDKDVQKCLEISRSLKKTTIKMLLDPPVN